MSHPFYRYDPDHVESGFLASERVIIGAWHYYGWFYSKSEV